VKSFPPVRWVLLTALVAAAAGCGRPRPPETAPVLAAFEVITNTNRFLLDLAVQQTREGNYTGALGSLAELERRYRLSPEQEIAVRTLRRDLQRRVPAGAAPTSAPPAPAARPVR
jgi:hypothetical protein